jgi:hypothetical protein
VDLEDLAESVLDLGDEAESAADPEGLAAAA